MPLSDARILEIIEETLAVYRQGEVSLAQERAQGLRCSCCNTLMIEPRSSGECADCEVL